MITKQEMEKVLAQVNSIFASQTKRIEALESEVAELKASQEPTKKVGRPKKVDTLATTN